jgi:hypothetical protein
MRLLQWLLNTPASGTPASRAREQRGSRLAAQHAVTVCTVRALECLAQRAQAALLGRSVCFFCQGAGTAVQCGHTCTPARPTNREGKNGSLCMSVDASVCTAAPDYSAFQCVFPGCARVGACTGKCSFCAAACSALTAECLCITGQPVRHALPHAVAHVGARSSLLQLFASLATLSACHVRPSESAVAPRRC